MSSIRLRQIWRNRRLVTQVQTLVLETEGFLAIGYVWSEWEDVPIVPCEHPGLESQPKFQVESNQVHPVSGIRLQPRAQECPQCGEFVICPEVP